MDSNSSTIIARPKPEEYSTSASGYINLVPDTDVLHLLAESMESSFKFFSELADAAASYAYAPGKWTIKQVLGHIIDTERIFAYRALVFSRELSAVLPGFDQDTYVNNANFDNRSIQDLALEYQATRTSNLYLFHSLDEGQLVRSGMASGARISARALVYMIAGHELHHLNVLNERYF